MTEPLKVGGKYGGWYSDRGEHPVHVVAHTGVHSLSQFKGFLDCQFAQIFMKVLLFTRVLGLIYDKVKQPGPMYASAHQEPSRAIKVHQEPVYRYQVLYNLQLYIKPHNAIKK